MSRPALRDTPLLDRLRRYPAGIPALARAAGISVSTAYAVAHAEAKRPPYRALERLATAMGVELDELAALWLAAKRTQERPARRRKARA